MNNIIFNIVNKKQNLSYPLVFRKIGNYFWNEKEVLKHIGFQSDMVCQLAVKEKWYKILKILMHINDSYLVRWTAYTGNLNILKYLVENGANIYADDNLALRWAIDSGRMEIIEYLVKKGAKLEPKNNMIKWKTEIGKINQLI